MFWQGHLGPDLSRLSDSCAPEEAHVKSKLTEDQRLANLRALQSKELRKMGYTANSPKTELKGKDTANVVRTL